MTDPYEHYGARAAAFAAQRAGAEPAWLKALRKDSAAAFAARGFPTTRQEGWRHTNVSALAKASWELPSAGGAAALTRVQVEAVSFPVYACSLFVFVNGRYAPSLSAPRALSGNLGVESLAGVLARAPERVEPWLGRLAPADAGPFVALNGAFFDDGAWLEIPAGVRAEAPIHVVHLSVPGSKPAVTHPRTLVVARRGSEATVIEDYVTVGEGAFWTNAVTEVHVEDGATLDLVKLQRESVAGHHLATLAATQGRDTRLTVQSLSLGAALARSDAGVVLAGEGAECRLDGLYVASGSQLADHHTRIDHAAPRGRSRELFKGILDDRARGVFHGTVIVREGAIGTDARQTNRNLLLSRDAEADSQPQLEISADDVKCSHGSTIGQLEEDALFYLRARGIGVVEAKRLLMRAFAAEVTDGIRQEPLRHEIEEIVLQRLRLAGRAAEAAA
jgi:Fe-S cluster assembly protein SufD